MSGKTVKILVITLLSGFAFSVSAYADGGTYGSYTPYSFYGVGDLSTPGTSNALGMAGIGIASRSNRFLNILNPAAVTARDSLSFMAEFSVNGSNKLFRQSDMKSVSNTFNINSCVMSFPLWNHMAMMVGITPYSNMGYGYSYSVNNPNIIAHTGQVNYSATGQGSLYQGFAAVGVEFFRRLSIGVQGNLYFGNYEKSYTQTISESSYLGYTKGYDFNLTSFSGKLGIQYTQPLGKRASLTLGATYNMSSRLGGYVTDLLTENVDTLGRQINAYLASEKGIGLSFNYADKLTIEFDYSRSDWSNSGFDGISAFKGNSITTPGASSFSSTLSQSYRLGGEYIPNRNDIRYYMKKCTYRAGLYYKNEYYLLDGNRITSSGITLGMTFPVFRWYNGFSFGLELGRRGTTGNNLIRETYFNFTFGLNIFDIWFQQPKYE